MANWEIKKVNASDINNGQQFNNGDGISAESMNAVAQAALYAQQIEAVDDAKLQAIKDTVPLVPNRPIYVNKNYADIRADIRDNTTTEKWLAEGDFYAFWYTDFNRTAVVGDKFGVICSSLDGYIFNISAEVISVIPENRVYFKILDRDLDEKNDFVLLYKAPLMFLYTLEPSKSKEEIISGYSDSAPLYAFNRKPLIGELFYTMVRNPYKDVFSMTARVSGYATGSGVDYAKFDGVEVILIHDGELDAKVDALLNGQ